MLNCFWSDFMYILIRYFEDNQICLVHIDKIGYDYESQCMWFDSHNSIEDRVVPISQKNYEKIIRKLFEVGKLDLSDTPLRAYYDRDLDDEE